MTPQPLIGVTYHWIGGFASATNFIPFRGIKRWSWEIYWLLQGIAAWIVAPLALASLLVPHLWHVLHMAPRGAMVYAALWGAMWGIGGLTFGLSVRYLGIALGYAVSLGLCTAFGTLIPPLYSGEMSAVVHQQSGQVTLCGVGLCLLAVAINGAAGFRKDRETTATAVESASAEFSLGKGLAVATFAGIMSAFFAFGLKAGAPIASVARQQLLLEGRLDLWQNLPVLVVVLWGGFTTNFIWSLALIYKHRSAGQFAGHAGTNPMRASQLSGDTLQNVDPRDLLAQPRIGRSTLLANYLLATAAGVLWYLQFFFYSLGQTKMGRYDFSSWTLHMASIIIFATLWGVVLREWRGTSRATRLLVSAGLITLIGSTLVVGYGNYLQSREASTNPAHAQRALTAIPKA